MALEDIILSILSAAPSDQYSLFRKIKGVRTAEVLKALGDLQRTGKIHVASYRRNQRTGFDIPVYSLQASKSDNLDVHPLLHGISSERHVEYDFVSRNLVPRTRKAKLLDIGSAGSRLAKALENFGGARWLVIGIDISGNDCNAMMDARFTGFRDNTFDLVTCISTIEHIGLSGGSTDAGGDKKVIQEIYRILKPRGKAIVTIPYGKNVATRSPGYRIYDGPRLRTLAGPLSIARVEFYRFLSGKWSGCTQLEAEESAGIVPLHFHSGACACLLLKKCP